MAAGPCSAFKRPRGPRLRLAGILRSDLACKLGVFFTHVPACLPLSSPRVLTLCWTSPPSAHHQVRDSAGNLNGAHPSSHGDPSLHAWVSAGSRQRLDKAVALLLEVMQPTNTRLKGVAVQPGNSVVLEPVIPR